MPRSFDSRRAPKHHKRPHQHMRGPKRTGPIGTVIPGDDVEVAREIQRLWAAIRSRKKNCCDDNIPDGIVKHRTGGYSELVQRLGPVAWWRCDVDPASLDQDAAGTAIGAYKDVSGVDVPLHMSLSGTPLSAPPMTQEADLDDLGDGFTTGLRFNFDRLNDSPDFTPPYDLDDFQHLYAEPPGSETRPANYGWNRTGGIATVSAWIKPKQTSDVSGSSYHGPVIAAWGDSEGFVHTSWCLTVDQHTGQLHFVLNDLAVPTAHSLDIQTATHFAFDQWLHVAVTFAADGTVTIYVNGNAVATGSFPYDTIGEPQNLTIGLMGEGGFIAAHMQAYLGALREVILFDRPLSQAEVTELFQTTGDTGTSGWDAVPVTGSDIADGAITPGKLAAGTPNTVMTADSDDGTPAWAKVTAAVIDALAVGTAAIADLAVTTGKLAASAVTTAKIADANVTTAKIADSNVTTAKIADSNVTTAKIADGAVTSAKIADGGITDTDIGAGQLNPGKLIGFPDDPTKALLGDGSWGAVSGGGGSATRQLEALWSGQVPDTPGHCQVWRVPQVEGADMTFNLDRATLRVETPSTSGDVVVVIEKSASGGVFTPTALVTLTLTAGAYDVSDTADLAGLTLTSGELVRARFSDVGLGATDFTIQLEGSE